MIKSFRTIAQVVEDQIVEKKSKFLCKLIPVLSEEQAKDQLEIIKKEHFNARHSCFAFRIGMDQPLERYSDDGEPSGTAGMPILEVLRGADLTNMMAVVTRYFGGTLLGTGGLVRAYTEATQAGLEAAEIIQKILQMKIQIQVAYTLSGKVEYYIHQHQHNLIDTEYGEDVCYHISVDAGKVELCIEGLREITSDQFKWSKEGMYYMYKLGNELAFEKA